MGVFSQWFRDPARQNKSGRVDFSGFFVTSTNGALVAASSDSPGYTLTKVGATAGRYTVQLVNEKGEAVVASLVGPLKLTPAILGLKATLIHTAAIAAGRARGTPYIRAGVATLASAGNFIVQFNDGAATPADAELTDGASFVLEFSLKRSTAVP